MEEFFNSEAIASSFANVGRVIANVLNGILHAINDAVQSLTKNEDLIKMLMKPISRKKFIKFLMANKIQRNEANIITKQIHDSKGGYCLFYLNEILNNREVHDE